MKYCQVQISNFLTVLSTICEFNPYSNSSNGSNSKQGLFYAYFPLKWCLHVLLSDERIIIQVSGFLFTNQNTIYVQHTH